MPPLLPLLKQAWDHRTLILAAALVFFIALSKHQSDMLDAEPLVKIVKVVEKNKSVKRGPIKRGPSKTTKTVTTTPDGTKTSTTVKETGAVEEGPSETTSSSRTASEKSSTPAAVAIAAARGKTWGPTLSLDLKRRDRGSAGLSKSFGDLSISVTHAWGPGAHAGDVSAGVGLKLW